MKIKAEYLLVILLAYSMGTTAAAPHKNVVIKTSVGDIKVELSVEKAPVTVANFLSYVDSDGYEGTIFHRVIEGFVVQGGGLLPDLTEVEYGDPIISEADNGLKNITGSVSMARSAEIDSADRQFFINVNDNSSLDHTEKSCTRQDEKKRQLAAERGLYKPKTCATFGYTVFGRVIGGMDIVHRIELLGTAPQADYEDVPLEPVTILEIERVTL